MQLSLNMHKSAMENFKKIKKITNNDNFNNNVKREKNMMNNFEKIKGKKKRTPTKTILEKISQQPKERTAQEKKEKGR